jgi:hypothetical protein
LLKKEKYHDTNSKLNDGMRFEKGINQGCYSSLHVIALQNICTNSQYITKVKKKKNS